jgi:hypothetical protein
MGDNQSTPITDLPWFWVLLFSLMALVALFSIGGKYGRRQSGIERQYQARERIAEGVADSSNVAADGEPRPDYATPGHTLVPLWPLAAVLSAIALISGLMLLRDRGRAGSLDGSNSP